MKKIKIGDAVRIIGETDVEDWMAVHILVGENRCIAATQGNVGESHNMFYLSSLEPLPTLHLPIGNSQKYGGCWFDMILSGVKKEEYRECSVFNRQRLCVSSVWMMAEHSGIEVLSVDEWKPFKVLHLTNGYGHYKPQLWAHIESITIGRGNPEWGAPTDRDVFIIRIGDVFHSKNLKA